MHWLSIAILLAVLAAVLAVRLRLRREEARAYLKGVRSMISDDPDTAIEALSDAARLGSPEAVETYLALGELFRRTGDVPRAIRLHRNMLHRPGLDPSRRTQVERELADDYRRAGMLSEAADTYRPMAASDPAAAEGLRDVLVAQGRLEEAIEIHERSCPADQRLLAHLFAGLARAREGGEALEAARRAVEADGTSADALLARAEVEAAAGAVDAAVASAAQALRAEPTAALLAWPALSALPVERALAVVEEVSGERPGEARLLLLRGRLLSALGASPEGLAEVRRAMERDDDGEVTLALRELLRKAEAPAAAELAARHDLTVAALVRQVRLLRCRRCGAGSAVRAWRCPRCGAFDAYP
jgi:lipopolysaccharide biosynthesis regulator YciM